LSGLARELYVSVPPPQPAAIASAPRNLRPRDRTGPGHRGVAGDRDAVSLLTARRDPLQLSGRAVRVRRPDARGSAAVDRSVCGRGHAEAAREGGRCCEGGRHGVGWVELLRDPTLRAGCAMLGLAKTLDPTYESARTALNESKPTPAVGGCGR